MPKVVRPWPDQTDLFRCPCVLVFVCVLVLACMYTPCSYLPYSAKYWQGETLAKLIYLCIWMVKLSQVDGLDNHQIRRYFPSPTFCTIRHLISIQLGISIIDTVDFYRPCATETVDKTLLYRH